MKTLGLDLGTNSIGWAVVNKADNSETEIIDKGVHIFQEGVNLDKGIESSKSAKRTEYRSKRKAIFRRRIRKIETLKVLSKYELCPHLSEIQLKEWQNEGKYPATEEFMEWQRTIEDGVTNPYFCRYEAVNRKLNLGSIKDRYLLGRALYHLAQRRGFLSNRLDSSEESEGKVKGAIAELSKEIENKGCKTLGEYFYTCYGNDKIRGNYTSRLEHYEAEFNHICDMQELSDELKRELRRAIFFQRPLKSQKGGVGRCSFEPQRRRCAVSHPAYERYRMLCFVNNIKIRTPKDDNFRPLNNEEFNLIEELFYRKSKETFEFEDIAKKIAGRGNYSYQYDNPNMPYLFNYKMTTTVSGCPVTSILRDIFGVDWQEEMHSVYTLAKDKSTEEVVNDIWHVLFTFDSDDALRDFAINKLQLDETNANKLVKLKMPQGYAALSLYTIKKIMVYLERGFIYSHATILANIDSIIPKGVWNSDKGRKNIEALVKSVIDNYDRVCGVTLMDCVVGALRDNYDMPKGAEKMLYHPSMVETYPDATNNRLGSPRTNSVRNPMAMRTLFQLRGLVNKLLADGKIDKGTIINVELARQLNNANMRKAIEQWNKRREDENKKYAEEIEKELKITPTKDDIVKYRLWIEQGRKCIYTNDEMIPISKFIGAEPSFDIEHTIPRSRRRDNSLENKTLANSRFNRDIKKGKIPSELAEFEDIKIRVEEWKDKIDDFDKRIEKNRKKRNFNDKESKDKHIIARNLLVIERDYWRGKYERIVAESVERKFTNSQGVDAGVISRYAVMYLKSLFRNVYSVKGDMVAEFRKVWGLTNEYEKKERVNHIHHCVDAITIACIDRGEYNRLSEYYGEEERYGRGETNRPYIAKPWKTFTEDVTTIADELLVSHYTPDNFGKNTRKKVRVRGEVVKGKYIQGDTVRGSLHKETYYGAIMQNNSLKYVIRKSLGSLEAGDISKIVDEVVREKVQQAITEHGIKAVTGGAVKVWMNEEKGVEIKKVRCFASTVTSPLHIRKHRDESKHDYKRTFNVVNDGNHAMAIYEGLDAKGKVKRDYKILSNYEAAKLLRRSSSAGKRVELIKTEKSGLPLKCLLKTGTMVLFYEKTPDEIWKLDKHELVKRLYKVTGMSGKTVQKKYEYGALEFRYHQEARAKGDLSIKNGLYVCGEEYRPLIGIYHTQFNALVQEFDFELDITGEIKPL